MHISQKNLCEILQKTTEKHSDDNSETYHIDKVDSQISYDDFFCKYLVSNRPCLFGNFVTRDWKSAVEWTSRKTVNNYTEVLPNFEYLKQHFGNAKVPVADCNKKYFNSQCKTETTFSEFITYWENYITQGYKEKHPCLYLKDWHFVKSFKNYKLYNVAEYFHSDWLNELSDDEIESDDFRFVYMGPKGSWTPFHADVYRSFSWSANICGIKKWLLFPPGDEQYLKNVNGELPFDVTAPEMQDMNIYPNAQKAHCLTIVQKPGELIFVPSGWYHQVHNLDDTISINHNWLNASNIDIVCNFLCSEFELVKKEIIDCKELMTEKNG
uniref:2-oxoglutarate and iron-dependent oxygenase JMJD4-like n=1 Tax=Styela clava TaxID=7725 RepID=UPI00193A2FC7|nr:2-oxoglutarate and iron-dependent oxygenase JMJD4-like [Styela clava]